MRVVLPGAAERYGHDIVYPASARTPDQRRRSEDIKMTCQYPHEDCNLSGRGPLHMCAAHTEQYLSDWSDSASRAGDSETMLIAEIGLRHVVDTDADYECGRRRVREISRMTPLGAQRLAARW